MRLIKTQKEIDKIRESSRIVREVKELLKTKIKIGASLLELDKIAKDFIQAQDAAPSFLGYNGFLGSVCASVNDVLIHGVPSDYKLQDGDVISIDVGAYKNGYHGDSAFTVGVGKLTDEDQLLIQTTKECLDEALKIIKDGTALKEVGRAIEQHALKNNFYLTKEFTGHGLGKSLHEEPFIFNVEKSDYQDFVLKAGMVVAIEPMLLIGSDKVYIDPIDDWSVRSKNGKNTAHEEHTILITKDGIEILT